MSALEPNAGEILPQDLQDIRLWIKQYEDAKRRWEDPEQFDKLLQASIRGGYLGAEAYKRDRQNNPEKYEKIFVENRQKTLEWREDNPELAEENAEENAARLHKWMADNPEKVREIARENIKKARAKRSSVWLTPKSNKTGFRGVYIENGKFGAVICANGRRTELGRFTKFEWAKIVRQAAEMFVDLGRPMYRNVQCLPNYHPISQRTSRKLASIIQLVPTNEIDALPNPVPKKIQANNKSGFVGINWYKKSGKWRTQVKLNNQSIHLGYFTELNDAVCARNTFLKLHLEKFYNHTLRRI